jgi:hypothetical protein
VGRGVGLTRGNTRKQRLDKGLYGMLYGLLHLELRRGEGGAFYGRG